MFTSRRISTLSLDNVQYLTRLEGLKKTVVVKDGGDFDIYTNEGLHTYRKLLEEPVFKICDSNSLSTLFVQCENNIVLLNTGSMTRYDRIIDKRGITDCWCLEEPHSQDNEKKTVLMVLLKTKVPRLRFFVWEDRKFVKWEEMSLSRKDELISSTKIIDQCIIFTTNIGIYLWKIGATDLKKLETTVVHKFAESLSESVEALNDLVEEVPKKDIESITDSFTKLYQGTLWRSGRQHQKLCNDLSAIFQPSDKHVLILDGRSERLHELHLNDKDLSHFKSYEDSVFFRHNSDFKTCYHFGSHFLTLCGENMVSIADYKTGYSYFKLTIQSGIKKVFQLYDTNIMIWTNDNLLEIYKISIEDKVNFSRSTINECIAEMNFVTLEKQVRFYQGILESELLDRIGIAEKNPDLLQEYAIKLRDIYIIYCLQIFERAQNLYGLVMDNVDAQISLLHERIIRRVFDIFLKFIAPPELVISWCFPEQISTVINLLLGSHDCLVSKAQTFFDAKIVKRSFIPYITEVRRHLRNIKSGRNTFWKYNGANVELSLSFFQSYDYAECSIDQLLAVIDTVIFMTYMNYSKPMVGYFVRIDNNCDFSIVERSLKEEKMIHELIDFYFTKCEHKKALYILSELMDSTLELRDNIKSLIIDYLRKLGPDNLRMIFEYSDILLQKFPNDSYEILTLIFLHPSAASTALPYSEVYDYIHTKRKDLSLSYLEFVIDECHSTETNLFSTLVKRYLSHIDESKILIKLRAVLSIDTNYEPRPILKIIRGAIQEEKNGQGTNIKSLKQLQVYPLNKMGEHETALNILWGELSDYKLCSEYCHSVYSRNSRIGEEALMYLLRKIMETENVQIKPKLLQIFLAEHGSKLKIEKVLNAIPYDVPLSQLTNYFSTELKKFSKHQASMHIHRNILESNLRKINYDFTCTTSDFYILTEERKCPVCSKPLITQAVESLSIITYKNKSYIAHVSCARKMQAKIDLEKAASRIKPGPILSDYL